MKLRNKRTGEIVTIGQELGDDFDGVGLMLWVDHVEGPELDDHKIYGSLAELNEEWEDYKPTEPLIEDEKIRKAVRAWAEASNIGVVKVAPYAVFDIESSACICFYGRVIKDKDEDKKSYTIAELCGEKEE